jgi:DNA-binding response OmpR family regulator
VLDVQLEGIVDTSTEFLIVDDEPLLLEQLRQLLCSWGYRVRVAQDAQSAIAALEEGVPDIVMTDLMLPDRPGYTILEYVHNQWPHLPVLVMTGYATLEGAIEALKHGAYDFLLKPITAPELEAALTRAHTAVALQRFRAREQQLQHVAEVALTLAHEINNPLGILVGELHYQIEEAQLAPEVQEALEVCLNSAQRIADVVRRIAALREINYLDYNGLKMLDLPPRDVERP